jgi:hypothetical protein
MELYRMAVCGQGYPPRSRAYHLTLGTLFSPLASLGLDDTAIRDVLRATEKKDFTVFLKDGWPLNLIDFSTKMYMSIGTAMLCNMIGNAAVGISAGATRIPEAWNRNPSVIVSSVYPAILKPNVEDEGLYHAGVFVFFVVAQGPWDLTENSTTWSVSGLFGACF